MNREIITNELDEKIKKGKGCIVFDFGCYFPFQNQYDLVFDFSVGMDELIDKKRNHRYPNKGYVTLSKKIGRKVSKIGYPYFVDFNNSHMLLALKVGYKRNYVQILFPLLLSLSKETPVCGLKLLFDFKEKEFTFSSCYSNQECGINYTLWTNRTVQDENIENYNLKFYNVFDLADVKNVIVCSEIIMPHSCKLDDLYLY